MEVKELIQEIKENLEKSANTRSIFGDIMKVEDMSIIPVGSFTMKGGGGGGFGSMAMKGKFDVEETKADESGTPTGKGGGLGLTIDVKPVGYIKIKDGEAEYVEIIDKTSVIKNALKVLIFMIVVSGIKNLFKRKKK
ncbi:MAG: hypothetical protein JW794_02825 [Candidatus Cloacimonetes bacterium]|nr:hypothetical protein [Candidatus Cloacimonadota bacterium]